MKFKQIYILYSNLHKKNRHSIFIKKFWLKYLFKIPLWSKIDNVLLFTF